MVEVIGFISVNGPDVRASIDSIENGNQESSDIAMEADSTRSPPNVVASSLNDVEDEHMKSSDQTLIHAVLVNCMIESTGKYDTVSHAEIQKDLLKTLTEFSLGDELAAQYILLHLLSNVYGRVGGEVLGKFSLNLVCSSIPNEILLAYGKMLYNFIELLVPNSLYLPLTIENLNNKPFVPKKDYKTNRLQTGLLQLPNHTHLMLDEIQLESGKLEAPGCLALQDLSELIKSQQLQYDFKFYKIPFHTNIPTMIVSEGKSLLPV